ncbi:MAG TPA: AAA family ATPase, partial [Trueperaceae bacterium]
ALAERGFKVFPIKAGAKTPPLWKNWPERAAATVPANWPQDANIGIHCEGLVVLDVDVRSGGNETLATLDLPLTLTTLTPTGGRHLFYRLPEGHPGVPNGANKLGPGIDVKSTRGYVMAPGSEVPAGRYRFEADTPIADAPAWLLEQLGEYTPHERSEVREVPDAPEDVVERAREWLSRQPVGDQAFKSACGLRDFGLSVEQAVALLLEHDGRSEEVLRPKVEHAYRYAQNDPGSKAASAEDFPVVEAAPEKPRPKLLRLNELAGHPPGPYLIKGLLQRHSHAVLYGAPGAGKTFVALDIAFHVASGRLWRGRRVHQGVVLYLAYEGIGGLAKRAAALLHHYGDVSDVPLYVVGADYNLREKAGRQALAADLGQLPEKPVLVVIDTLARAMKGGDENSAQDMGALNDAVSALIQATGACVMLVHHSGKNKASGARGSSALLGA